MYSHRQFRSIILVVVLSDTSHCIKLNVQILVQVNIKLFLKEYFKVALHELIAHFY